MAKDDKVTNGRRYSTRKAGGPSGCPVGLRRSFDNDLYVFGCQEGTQKAKRCCGNSPMVPASRRAQVKQWEVAAFPQLPWPSEGNRFSLGGITMAAHLTDGVTMVIIKNLGTVSVRSCKVRL